MIESFDHYTVRAADIEASTRFYVDLLGFRAQTLTDLGFQLVMLYLGEQAVVHLLETGPGLDAFMGRPAPAIPNGPRRITGNMEHIAFNGTGLGTLRQRLVENGVRFTERILKEYGGCQLFVNDPDGVELEINFPLEET